MMSSSNLLLTWIAVLATAALPLAGILRRGVMSAAPAVATTPRRMRRLRR
jgi:hypothetical protein